MQWALWSETEAGGSTKGFVSLLGALGLILVARSPGETQSRACWGPVHVLKDGSAAHLLEGGRNHLGDDCGHPGTGGAPGLEGSCPGQPHTQSGRFIRVLSALRADAGVVGPSDQPSGGALLSLGNEKPCVLRAGTQLWVNIYKAGSDVCIQKHFTSFSLNASLNDRNGNTQLLVH